MTTNVGIIGLGHMGRLHMMNCLHMEGIEVVAAADKSKEALMKAKSLGVKNLYTDYHELLNDPRNIDAVVISLPNFLHFESIQLALETGLNVFVEKPMTATANEGREIVKLVEKSGRKFMIGHCMRFIDSVEKMKGFVDKGHIGNIEAVTIEEISNGPFAHGIVPKPIPEWWFDSKKTGGGVLIDLGYHHVDLFRFFAGDAEVIFSYLDHTFNLPVEDKAMVMLRSQSSSAVGVINVGWYQRSVFPRYNFRVIVHGDAGFLSSDFIAPRNIYTHAIKEGVKNFSRKVIGKKIRPLSYTYYFESYYKEMKHFFDCIRYDTNPAVSVCDGLKTMELIEEAYKRAKYPPSQPSL